MSNFDYRTSLFDVYPPLSAEQRMKVQDFIERVAKVPSPPTYLNEITVRPFLFATKWLTSRKWNVEAALEMYSSAGLWRLHHCLDTHPIFPAMRPVHGYDEEALLVLQGPYGRRARGQLDLTEDAFSDVSPSRWHFFDKQYRPVLIERSGLVNSDEMARRCYMLARPGEHFTKNYTDYDVQINEIGNALVDYNNRYRVQKPGVHVSQVTVVMDLKGMSMKHFTGTAFELMNASTELAQRYYPEGLHKVLCVNAPSIAAVGWRLFQPFLDKGLQAKVKFCPEGEETRKALFDVIGEERTPKFLGGKCDCPGGCVPIAGDAGAPDRWSAVSKRYLTHHTRVSAGGQGYADFEVTEGSNQTLRWALHVDSHDVDVDVTLSSADGSQSSVLSTAARASHVDGEFMPDADLKCSTETPCKLRFSFDNRFSWVNRKDVRWRVEPKETFDQAMSEARARLNLSFANPEAARNPANKDGTGSGAPTPPSG